MLYAIGPLWLSIPNRFAFKRSRLLLALCCAGLTGAWLGQAQSSVTLAWDPNQESFLGGYYFYSQVVGSTDAPKRVKTGLNTRYTVQDLVAGKTYAFHVTAYSTSGLESAPSNVVQYQVPTAQPGETAVTDPPTQPSDPAGCHPDLVSYWRLDETTGNRYADSAGGNSGSSSTPPSPVTGRVSGAQQFNGTSQGIIVPRMAAYDFAVGTSFTLEAWIKRPSGSYAGEEVILERRDSGGGLSMKLGFNATSIGFTARNDSYQLYEARGTTSLYDGRWHHVVGVRDAARNQLRVYVDGALQKTVTAPYSAGFTSSKVGFTIGYRNVSKPEKFFRGAIDEVAVYKSGLDAATIALHYQNGLQNKGYCTETSGPISSPDPTGCDPALVSYWRLDETTGNRYADSAGGNSGSSSTPPSPVTGRVSGAQQFNGTSQGIIVPRMAAYDFAVGTSFTLEAWIKRPSGSYAGEEVVLERRDSGGGLSMKLGFNSTSIGFTARNDSYQLYEARGTTSLYDGRWHHVVGVRDAARNQLRVYVDGALQKTVTAPYSAGFTSSKVGFTIGYRNVSKPEKFFRGAIDEVAVYKSGLDAATIALHYQNGLQNKGYCDTSGSSIAPASARTTGEDSDAAIHPEIQWVVATEPSVAPWLDLAWTLGEPHLLIYGLVGKTYRVEHTASLMPVAGPAPSWFTVGIFNLAEVPQLVPESSVLSEADKGFYRATEVVPVGGMEEETLKR